MTNNTKKLDVKLEVLLKKVFKIQKIDLEASMDDISEWDSLTHAQLISAIEKEFKIKIKFDDVIRMISIPIIKKKIVKYM
tara:strand:- start:46 stop:285 length:240 start_codon:yes stop_codon:yes gene_type:complete